MQIIGSYDAKTHWSAILEKVAAGDEIVITRRGKALARLIPEIESRAIEGKEILTKMRSLRKGINLEGLNWKELRDEGRK